MLVSHGHRKTAVRTASDGLETGVYDDIKTTFRAPIVNWIFRVSVANHSAFLRYAWAQVKPAFQTRAFGRFSVEYRDRVLSTMEGAYDLPVYRREEIDVSSAEYGELRGQIATFDVVAPRLAVLFELVDRGLHGRPIGAEFDPTRAASAPLPGWLDRDRGRPPTMIAFDDVPDDLQPVVRSLQEFHGLDTDLPSIYRCLAQWPELLDALWTDLEPALTADAFRTTCEELEALIDDYVDSLPYTPQLAPAVLENQGLAGEAIDDLQELFRSFNTGPIETVLPVLALAAHAVGVTGERALL